MFQIDEKVLADNRTLITIQDNKNKINLITKNGTLHYSQDTDDIWLTTAKIRQAYINKDPNVYDKFDKIIIARDGVNIRDSYKFLDSQTFAENVEIQKDLLVKGNLTVQGNTTIIDTPTLTVEDNIIELNRNESAAGITLRNSGMAINRGSKPFARYLYNEDNKSFVLDTASSIDGEVTDWLISVHAENGSTYQKGDMRIKRKLYVPFLDVSDSLTVDKTVTRTLVVNETSNLKGAVTADSSVTVGGAFIANSTSDLKGVTNIWGQATFKSDVNMQKRLTVTGLSTFGSLATFNNGITVTAGGASITGATTLTGTLNATENVIFNKDLNVGGTITTPKLNATNLTASNATITNDLTVNRDALIKRNLSVTGTSTLTGAVTANSNVTINNGTTTINGTKLHVTTPTEHTSSISITNAANLTISSGNLTVGGTGTVNGALKANSTAHVVGNTTLDANLTVGGNETITGTSTANNYTSKNNFSTENGNGKGYRFWNSDNYKIYMSTTDDTTHGGSVTGASTSDYNMYFKMGSGTNRGFVFKSGNNSIMQLESTGKLRTTGHMYANGSQVLRHADMGHQPSGQTAINACMVDGKHSTDLLLLDGSQKMKGDLDMATFKIKWTNNDSLSFNDNAFNVVNTTYDGLFAFNADEREFGAAIKAGALVTKNVKIDGNAGVIQGMSQIIGKMGIIAQSIDGWLRINDGSTVHSDGVYFGSSVIRTDGSIQLGSHGSVLNITKNAFTYNGKDVLTTDGHAKMTGDLNMAENRICFNTSSISGTAGIASSDYGYIFGEHDADSETSRLVISIADNDRDSIVLRTRTGSGTKNSMVVNYNQATFSDNPYYGSNRLLHTGDLGSGNNLDADKVDGLHASSFLRTDANSTLGQDKLLYLGSTNAYMKGKHGGAVEFVTKLTSIFSDGNIVLAADNDASAPGTEYVQLKSGNTDGLKVYSNNITYLGNKVWHAGNDGANSGCDADLLDGHHASYFATANHNHDSVYTKKSQVDTGTKYSIQYNSTDNSLDFMYIG